MKKQSGRGPCNRTSDVLQWEQNSGRVNALRKKLRKESALLLALFPIPYAAAIVLLLAVTDALKTYLNSVGLLWQCLRALGLALFVLGPMSFIISSICCIYHAARELRSRKSVRKNIILILVALATIALSVVWFKWYWPVPA